jgi:hypothetical protein
MFKGPPPLPDTLEDAHRVIGLLWEELKRLAAVVERQSARIEELEEQLNCNSANSSTPPSQGRCAPL